MKTAAILHAVSSTPVITLPSDTAYHIWDDDVIIDLFEIHDGSIAVPGGSGFGVKIDEEKLESYRIDP